MAGETEKDRAVCISVRPWSRTSHVVTWLTPRGKVATSVKGAVRPKSAFLGQYDLNYTCEIVWYSRSRGDLHALRECSPVEIREGLRGDWRSLLAAEHFRAVASDLAPAGPEAAAWLRLLESSLDGLCVRGGRLGKVVAFEAEALRLAGLSLEIEAESGFFALRGERRMPVSPEVARCLRRPEAEKNPQILLDAARVIGVFYSFHLDGVPETRRAALRAAVTKEEGERTLT
jgi:hypothetical protein